MSNLEKRHFPDEDTADLRRAKLLLEYPGLAIKIANILGTPIEKGFALLPHGWQDKVAVATRAALLKGLEFSIQTLGKSDYKKSRDWIHRLLVVGTGAAGGAIGFASLPIELPVSTCVILRSVADIARSEGHDTFSLEVKLSCLQVLALGGARSSDNAAEAGYWTVRLALAKIISEAATYIAEKGLAEKAAPQLVRLIASIAARFSTVVSEEVAAKAVPVIGAVGGAAVNYIFMDHFQDMAHGHFIILRLEKKYGTDTVRAAYNRLEV